jgi:hypothetical protein
LHDNSSLAFAKLDLQGGRFTRLMKHVEMRHTLTLRVDHAFAIDAPCIQ